MVSFKIIYSVVTNNLLLLSEHATSVEDLPDCGIKQLLWIRGFTGVGQFNRVTQICLSSVPVAMVRKITKFEIAAKAEIIQADSHENRLQ